MASSYIIVKKIKHKERDCIALVFDYNYRFIQRIESLAGREYNPTKKYWYLPLSVQNIEAFIALDLPYVLADNLIDWLVSDAFQDASFGFVVEKRKRLYKGKYRIETARFQNWDYSGNGSYFITICIRDRNRRPFGDIVAQKMNLSGIGQIARDCWDAIPEHFPFVELGASVIMPDHVHGIITVNKPKPLIETQYLASQKKPKTKNKFGPQSQNLASIVRGFKVGVTKNARMTDPSFRWQPRYYCSIIWNDEGWQRISNYILDNPKNWKSKQLKDILKANEDGKEGR